MTNIKITAVTALTGLALGLVLALPGTADAAKRRTTTIYYGSEARDVQARSARAQARAQARQPTRLTVRRRSFLDAGTETLQRDQHYTDYSHPPGYTPYFDRNDPTMSFSRMPLPDPWDIPGWPKY